MTGQFLRNNQWSEYFLEPHIYQCEINLRPLGLLCCVILWSVDFWKHSHIVWNHNNKFLFYHHCYCRLTLNWPYFFVNNKFNLSLLLSFSERILRTSLSFPSRTEFQKSVSREPVLFWLIFYDLSPLKTFYCNADRRFLEMLTPHVFAHCPNSSIQANKSWKIDPWCWWRFSNLDWMFFPRNKRPSSKPSSKDTNRWQAPCFTVGMGPGSSGIMYVPSLLLVFHFVIVPRITG